MTEADRARSSAQSEQQTHRPPPRSSSPAKRLHSDMDDTGKMDVDPSAAPTNGNTARRGSGQSSPRATRPLPAGSSQRSLRATSVEMADAPPNTGSGSSETEASNADSSATSVETTQLVDIPSLDEQVAKVMVMTQQQLQDRQEGYVISESWLERVFARTSENSNRPEQFSKEATQGPIGPVDNSNLVDTDALREDLPDQRGEDFVPLRKGLQMGQDFEVLPAKAWDLVVGWYGLKDGSPTIRRYAHNTSTDKYRDNLEYELFPPILTIRKVRKSTHPVTETEKRAEKMVVSRSDGYASFLDAAKKAVGINPSNKVRVWRIIKTIGTEQPATPAPQQPSGILTPDASPRDGSPVTSLTQLPSLVMESVVFNQLAYGTEREVVGKDDKASDDFGEQLTVGAAGLGEDQIIVLEEHDEKGEYLSDSLKVFSKNKAGLKGKGLQSGPNSGRSTPALGGPMTRGRTRNGRVRGTVGLTNLGNTCYMNSALQCIRSVEELSTYFLTSKWKEELNEDNPLGHNGSIAKAYSGLLGAIYGENANSSFAPKIFKQTLGRAQPIFSGYGQQDSQEFLSFLVDGLHEDLNRIKKKPYTENPESDDKTVHDPEAIKALGEKFRAIHRSRNDSVAMDLFNGFYKNTMVCPDCGKVSITFDPYSLLTLQLPIEQTWTHTVTFVPLCGKLHQVEVDMDKNATIKTLKEYVGKRFGVKANRLMASEVYSHKFYRHLYDYHTIAESNIGQRDDIWVYELDAVPSNWPPPENKERKYRSLLFTASSDEDIPDSNSPVHDRVLIPVFNRGPNMSTYQSKNWSMALWPTYVVLTREEAKDYDLILKKVLRNVSQMTSRPILTELGGNSLDQSRSGSDVILTTEEDASPNGDPNIKDGSISGEDMVEVTMTDPAQAPEKSTDQEDLADVLKPGTFIHPEFRQLFEMKHTRADSQMVTNGWSTVDHSKALEAISKRIKLPPSRHSSVASSTAASDASSSEETDEPQFSADANAAIEAANVSSDEEMESIEAPSFSRGGRQRKQKKKSKHQRKLERKHANNKNFKSYSKKGKIPEQPSPPSYLDNEDDESLIRMGEAIVLEWNHDAFDALFGGITQDDSRGMDTLKLIEHYDDPELDEKKAKRAARRKNGITLDECFLETSKSEVLSEDNAWYCNRCKELRRATKTLEIWTVPDILVIHLKRFSAHRAFRDKIEALVDFPIEGLDLTGKVGLPEDKELVYDLFAVDNHFGGLGGGHYTAFAQNFFDKQWYDYNDSMVSKHSNPRDAVTRNAYLLFYRRRSSGPLGPADLQRIVNEANSAGSEEEESSSEEDPQNASRDPSGNGSRLGDSSRNGSSSAFGAGAGAVVLRGAGSASAGNLALKEAGAGTLDDDMEDTLPAYDEGYEEDPNFSGIDIDSVYAPLHAHTYDEPVWSFNTVPRNTGSNDDDVFDDDAASDAPNLGSHGPDDLDSRMLEDFGDDMGTELGTRPGQSTPFEEEVPVALGGEHGDGEVAEIHVKAD